MITLIFLVITIVSGELERFPIPKYEGVKSAMEHPKFQEALARNFPHIFEEITNQRKARIVNGIPAELGQIPYQVLMYMTADGNSWYTCGGVLVRRNWILTAAHCIENYNRIDVYFGLVDRPPGFYHWGTIVTGKSNFIIHPDRNTEQFSYDVGLIRVEEAPDNLLSSPYVDIVKLPKISDMEIDLTDKIGIISGFGRVNNSLTSLSPVLLYAEALIMDNAECAAAYGPFVKRSNICINTRVLGTSTCGGDSGGPLTVDGPFGEGSHLAGLVSFGHNSCTSGYPTVFARVTHFIEWISSIISPVAPPEGGTCNCVCNCHTCPALSDPQTDNFWRK